MSFVFLICGLFTLLLTILKPAFYWESRKARSLRRLVGDTTASIIYIVIAIFLMGISLA